MNDTSPIIAAAERNRIIMETATLRQQQKAKPRRGDRIMLASVAFAAMVAAFAWWPT